MNQSLRRILATTVLVCATGVPFAANAEENNQISSLGLSDHEAEALPTSTNRFETLLPELGTSSRTTSWDLADFSDSIEIISHALDRQPAATLSVHSIPVLTFVDVAASGSNKADNEASVPDPVARSLQVARQLDAFRSAAGDPNSIRVRWDAALKEYLISLGEEPLVAINEATLFSETTGDVAEDALYATNRLRRLLGATELLTDIEGRPAPPAPVVPAVPAAPTVAVLSSTTGNASWYGPGFHGRPTASGEAFNQNALTAAHRTLPFGTRVRVTNLNNNRQVIVRINDRGPFAHGRILDLSAEAARVIGLDRAGVGPVRLEVLAN